MRMSISRIMFALSLISAAATDSDTETLNTVYKHWGSPPQLASWDAASGTTACNMTGISCDIQANVVSLYLYSIPTGQFDQLLFNLTSLTRVALIQVNLVGFIPAQISQLTSLRMLQTTDNFLTGSIPVSLSLLAGLTSLDLNSNQLTGSIPQQLSTLTLLGQLQLGNNMISGPLPVSLSTLMLLENFYAPFNNLTGPIPAQYSSLQRLCWLSLSSNSLTSTIPVQLTSINSLRLTVNRNKAMCGPSHLFGLQRNTSIGQNCPDQSYFSYERISSVVTCLVGCVACGVMQYMIFKYNTIKRFRDAIPAAVLQYRAAVQVTALPSIDAVQHQPIRQMQPLKPGMKPVNDWLRAFSAK